MAPVGGVEFFFSQLTGGELEMIADFLVEIALVAFDVEDVVTAFFNDLGGDFALGAHGVDSDDGSLEVEHFQQLGDGGDLVAFVADEEDLAEVVEGVAAAAWILDHLKGTESCEKALRIVDFVWISGHPGSVKPLDAVVQIYMPLGMDFP